MTLSLRSFLAAHEAETLRLTEPVSVVHAVTALQHALDDAGRYPIVRVENPLLADGRKATLPLVTNLGASRALAARVLGFPTHREAARGYAAGAAAGIDPVVVAPESAPVREIVAAGADADLTALPALVQHALDPGPYLTAAHATTVDPESGIDNTGIQRCWIKGPRLMSWFPYPASHNMRNLRKYWTKGEACPVAFWIGHHPAVLMGAQAKLGYPESHWRSAGGLARAPVRLAPSLTFGDRLMVPADAEIVIEGRAPPGRLEADGPFGEYTSYSGPQVAAPVVEVAAVTRRRDAVYHDIGSGLADALVADNIVNEGKLYAAVKRVAPSLVNVHVPVSGRRFHAYLQLDRPAPGEARDAVQAALADRRTKAVFAFDADIDIFDERHVLWAVATRVQWARDSWVVAGLSGSSLDPSWGPGQRTTSKIGVDATLPHAAARDAPPPIPPVIRVPELARAEATTLLHGKDMSKWPSA
jgi:2,5-furandicarboxylate decarboxylase 1